MSLRLTRIVLALTVFVLAAITARMGWITWLFLSHGAQQGNFPRLIAAFGYAALVAIFALPVLRERILKATARSGLRGLVIFLATLVLFAILIPLFGVARTPWALAGAIGFAVAYAVVFILPGLAYRPHRRPRAEGGRPVEMRIHPIRDPRLRALGFLLFGVYLSGLLLALAGLIFLSATPSPDWLRTVRMWSPVTTLALAAPLSEPFLTATYTGGTGGLDSATGQKVLGILSALLVAAVITYQFQTKALVWGWNRLADAPFESRSVMVSKAESRSGLKGCNARIVAFAEDRPDATFDLCNYPRAFVATLKPGDRVETLARTSYLGMSEIRLRRTGSDSP